MTIIVGNGLVASALKRHHSNCNEREVIIASGVSNSSARSKSNFAREHALVRQVLEAYVDCQIVYFSSSALFLFGQEPPTPYFRHKLSIENLIRSRSRSSIIFRLPQLVGPVVNTTIVPSFVSFILHSKRLTIQSLATRRLLGVDDLARIVLASLDEQDLEQLHQTYLLSPLRSLYAAEIATLIAKILSLPLPEFCFADGGYQEPFDSRELPPCVTFSDAIHAHSYPESVFAAYVPIIASMMTSAC